LRSVVFLEGTFVAEALGKENLGRDVVSRSFQPAE
jgi:hypothetical protein